MMRSVHIYVGVQMYTNQMTLKPLTASPLNGQTIPPQICGQGFDISSFYSLLLYQPSSHPFRMSMLWPSFTLPEAEICSAVHETLIFTAGRESERRPSRSVSPFARRRGCSTGRKICCQCVGGSLGLVLSTMPGSSVHTHQSAKP